VASNEGVASDPAMRKSSKQNLILIPLSSFSPYGGDIYWPPAGAKWWQGVEHGPGWY